MPASIQEEAQVSKGLPLYPDYLRKWIFEKALSKPSYPNPFTAHYDPSEKVDMVGPFEFEDPGLRADPKKPNLLAAATKISELSPWCGTELLGVQLVRLFSLYEL